IELFTQRAAAVEPSFELTDDNVGTVAEICARLEGLPLAIELAAARVKLLPPRDMLKLLTDAGGGFSLRLLSGGARDAPGRHHALQATIDWSYQLLTQSEQWLFRCLSVFAGGFNLDAAGAVCCDSEYRSTSPSVPYLALDVLDNIASLLDKSLLRQVDGLVEEQRFSMLESIRKFGTKKLNECGENDVARDRNSRYCYQLALEAKSMLTGPQQAAWMDRLDDEHYNLRAALSWLLYRAEKGSDLYTNEAEMALKMVSCLYLFWDTRGYVGEGRRWIERALAFGQVETKTRADALNSGGWLAYRQSDMQEAQLLHEQALTISRQLDYKQGTAEALGRLGFIHDFNKSPHEQVEAYLSESLQLWREVGDTRGVAQALGPLAEQAASRFDFERASAFYSESLDLFSQIGDKREIAGALWNLGDLALREGDCEGALTHLNESLELYRELKDTHGVATQLRCLAEVARCQGDLNQAVTLCKDALSAFQEIGDKRCTSETLLGLARVAIDQGDYPRARRLARDGMEICVKIGHVLCQARQHWLLGLCDLEQGDLPSAQGQFINSLKLNQKTDHREGISPNLDGLARVAILQEDYSRAVRLFAASEAIRSSTGISQPPIDMAVDTTKLKPHPEQAQEALNEIDYQTANAEGSALTLEQAIELAISNDTKDL
ncbi:MAG: tetratricopeptide repeat protein, partial [Anaerolineales bacterium]|nr:tetratricopeptide repeat protein [Anaerolineales bacterium]